MRNRIREIRKKQGISQSKLAQLTGIPTSTLSEFENGLHDPGEDRLRKIAQALNVSLNYIQGGKRPIRMDGKPCDYCDFNKKDRAAYPLYGAEDKFLGFVYVNHDGEIAVDLMRVGTLKTKDQVDHCPNCGRRITDD